MVLLLDDDAWVTRGVLRLLASMAGVQPRAAATEEEGRRLIVELQPDAVIVDLGLIRSPTTDDLPFLGWLRAAVRPETLLILSSGAACPDAFAVDDRNVWLPKPFNRAELARAIGFQV